MPTTLPARARPVDPRQDLGCFLRALFRMYAIIASVVALLIAIEAACGAFTGQSLAVSILIATGTDLPEANALEVQDGAAADRTPPADP